MAYGGGQYTITASATTITSALGLTAKVHCKGIILTGKTGNAQKIYHGGSTVTNVPANARGEIGAGITVTLGPHDGSPLNTDEVFLVGTASDVLFITLIF